ncbi:hypothetical protein JCM9534A_36100 [Catenuloplanes indicus JCM 9534]
MVDDLPLLRRQPAHGGTNLIRHIHFSLGNRHGGWSILMIGNQVRRRTGTAPAQVIAEAVQQRTCRVAAAIRDRRALS